MIRIQLTSSCLAALALYASGAEALRLGEVDLRSQEVGSTGNLAGEYHNIIGPFHVLVLGGMAVVLLGVYLLIGCTGCHKETEDRPHKHDSRHTHDNGHLYEQSNPHLMNGIKTQGVPQDYNDPTSEPQGSFVTKIEISGDPDSGLGPPSPQPLVGSPAFNNVPPAFPGYNQPGEAVPHQQIHNQLSQQPLGAGYSQGPVVLLNNPGGGGNVINSGSVAPAHLSSSGFGTQPAGPGSLMLPRSLIDTSHYGHEGDQGGIMPAHVLRPTPHESRVQEQGGLFQVPALKPVPQSGNSGHQEPAGLFPKPHLRHVPETNDHPVPSAPPPEPAPIIPVFDTPFMMSDPPKESQTGVKQSVSFADFDGGTTISRAKNMSMSDREMGAQEEITYALLNFTRE